MLGGWNHTYNAACWFFLFFNEKELEGNLEMIESRALVLQKENQIKIPVVSDI